MMNNVCEYPPTCTIIIRSRTAMPEHAPDIRAEIQVFIVIIADMLLR